MHKNCIGSIFKSFDVFRNWLVWFSKLVGAAEWQLFLCACPPRFFMLLKSPSLSLSESSAVDSSSSSPKDGLTLLCRLDLVYFRSLEDLILRSILPRCLPFAFLSKYESSLSETSIPSSASTETSPSQSLSWNYSSTAYFNYSKKHPGKKTLYLLQL